MELGLGVLEWSPRQFWAATLGEFLAALDGYAEKNGADRNDPGPMTREELEELKARYPDG